MIASFRERAKRRFAGRPPCSDVRSRRGTYCRRLRGEPLEQRRVLSAGPLYVDADSTAPVPDGLTWATAYPALQDALDRADGSDVWIAEGTYRPTRQSVADSPRSETFQPLGNVALYGGFAGTEDSPDQRVRDEDGHFTHETILSGDLLGNDHPADETTFAENAYTVVRVGPDVQTILDGLTITAGRSTDWTDDHRDWGDGGGIWNKGTLIVTNSTVSGNLAAHGGGVYNGEDGTVTLTDSTVSGNLGTRTSHSGGGIYNYDGTLTVTNCRVSENSGTSGSGILSLYGRASITNSTISGNSSSGGAGAILNVSKMTITSSTISGNSGMFGGGIRNHDLLTITNSTISGNSAFGGGGVANHWFLTIANSTVAGNVADRGGGIYHRSDGIIPCEDCVTVTNSIVAGNGLPFPGGEAPDVYWTEEALSDASDYNLIGIWPDDLTPPPNTLVGKLDSPLDPRLGPLGDNGGETWTMPLSADSPALDAGDPNPLDPPQTDQRGAPRIVDGDGDGIPRIDMGAVEYQPDEALVLGRHVFYNNSSFDGNDPAANQADDAAIATDKRALLPGQTATFAHYTSYSRGINGVMVDVAGLAAAPTAEDFEFRVGNHDDPSGWPAADVAPEITVRPDSGLGGSDRITLIWPEGAIDEQWLQVTVLATANTGLAQPNVFYFGNAIGECGDSTSDAKVNAVDMLGARDNQRDSLDPAPIDFHFDYDRDARVNAADMLIARNNTTHFLDALKLITVPDRGVAQKPPTNVAPAKIDWLRQFDRTDHADEVERKNGTGAITGATDYLFAS